MRTSLKVFALVMAVLLLVGVAGAIDGVQKRTAASAAAASVAQASAGPAALRIMTIGESTNTGLGSFDGCGYRSKLAELMHTAGGGGTDLPVTFTGNLNGTAALDCKIPYGHFSPTVQDLRANILGWLNADVPDVIIIMTGIRSSAGEGIGLTNFQSDVTGLLNDIAMWRYPNNPQQIFIATVPYSVSAWASNEVSANIGILNGVSAFAPYPAAAAMIHVARADYMPCTKLADGVHPDQGGYDVIAYQIYRAMVPVFGLTLRPLNSDFYQDQRRPGYERVATQCT